MNLPRTTNVHGIAVPTFLYGTAWKEQETTRLVLLAIEHGFRGIDTANQRRHYFEQAVGDAVAEAIDRGWVEREQLFLQTKFTFQGGQDHRLPYDPSAPVREQVAQSLASSLVHLRTKSVDSLVLHGPSRSRGLGKADWEAWKAMEELHRAGQTQLLGVSNVTAEQLDLFCEGAEIKPVFVQNRCFAARGWDADVRAVCRRHAVHYQGFSLLTANPKVLQHPTLHEISRRHQSHPTQTMFAFALSLGMMPLTGTSNPAHMDLDLAAYGHRLTEEEVAIIERLGR